MTALGLAHRKLSRLFLLLRWIVVSIHRQVLPPAACQLAKPLFFPFGSILTYDMVNNQILVLQAVNRQVKWVAIVVTSQLRSGIIRLFARVRSSDGDSGPQIHK